MAETNLAFSKIVSTPTPTAWSQAYSAGRLFAALSLQINIIPQEGEEHLNSIGKDLISTLESEFFTIENKDLDSIKQAILTTTARIKEGVTSSLVVCFLTDNILYLFATGGAKAVLKRGDKIGTVLEGEENSLNIKSASGYVQEGDIIILQTKPFLGVITSSTLASSLDNNNPDDIAEDLAPRVHEKGDGGAAAVILNYKDMPIPEGSIAEQEEIGNVNDEAPVEGDEDIPEKEAVANDNEHPLPQPTSAEALDIPEKAGDMPVTNPSPFLTDQIPQKRGFSLNFGSMKRLGRQRRIILVIAIILIALILVTAFLAIGNKGGSQNQQTFDSVYNGAQTKFDEGENLKGLNAKLAQQSFKEAQKIITDSQSKFTDSDQKQKLDDLLAKVNSELENTSSGEKVEAKEVSAADSKMLSYEINNPNATYFTENDDNVYFLDGSGVTKVDKGNDKKSVVIKKSWKTDGGIGLFGSNVYVLDRNDGILKFVATTDTFSKTNYFGDESPDFSDSMAMAIDGSIYVLNKDGTIDKYTKGKKDTFSISGLDKPLSSATKIFTNEDASNIYVLDNGNGRIVVIDKDGKFKTAYSADVVKNAKDFQVSEKDKKIFVLSGGKVWRITIK